MNNPRTLQANSLLRDGRRGVQEGGEDKEKEKKRNIQMTNAGESEKNRAMVEHDEECITIRQLVTLFHRILIVSSFAFSLSCRTKEKQLSFQHSRSRHFKMKSLSLQEKHILLLKLGLTTLLLIPNKTSLNAHT
jgi:hypothetical protein